MKKKLWILVSALLCCAMFAVGVSAAWDGTAAGKFSTGSGTEASPYLIRSESHMGYFISKLNAGENFEGKYIKLDSDLDMTGHPWTYDSAASFAGTFIGYAHTVKTDCTLLPDIAASGVVTGLNVEAKTTVTRAILCDTNYGLIQMCCVRGSVANSPVCGMLCAVNKGTVQYCGAIGEVSAHSDDADAYAAMIAINHNTIDRCFSAISVSASAEDRAYIHPITADGTSASCYYDNTLYTSPAPLAKGFTLKDNSDFLNAIATYAIPGYKWSQGTDRYPVIEGALTQTVTLQGAVGDITVFHANSTRCTLQKEGSAGRVYYTTDGSDPRSPSSSRSYFTTSSSNITIRNDTVVRACYSNGTDYGPVMRHTFIQLKGEGTASNPYQITTKRQLDAVRLEPDKCYVLKNNLTYTAEDYALGGAAEGGWVSFPSFSGTFDGDGCSITGLRGATGGLFDSNTGTLKNLRLLAHELSKTNTDYSGYGSIANKNSGTISRCYAGVVTNKTVIGQVKDSEGVGGIAGTNWGTIEYCYSSGKIHADAKNSYDMFSLGGIAGKNEGTVSSCYSDAALSSDYSSHDMGVVLGGIAAFGTVCDSRFDGYGSLNTYHSQFGVGAAARWGNRANSYRCYDGGAIFAVTGSPRIYYSQETDLYKATGTGKDRSEATFPALDFSTVCMITEDGPFPQGVMDADGHCWEFSRWISEPSCTADASMEVTCALCGKTETRTITAPGHDVIPDAAVESTCTAPGKTAGSHCGRCGTGLEAQGDIPQLEHNYVNRICTECSGKIPTITAGKCGDSLSWELGEDGVLLISGSGAMWDRDESAAPLWYAYRGSVKEVRLPADLHSVGAEAFRGCTALTQISLSRNILTVGENAFADCTALSIIGDTGTAAHTYARANSVPFISLTKHAETPAVTSAPASAEYILGDTAAALTLTASVSDGGVLRYQWFVSDTAEGDGTRIDGAADTAFLPDVSEAGVRYYYAVITNTNTDATESQAASVRTDTVSVTVRARVDAAVPVITEQPIARLSCTVGDPAGSLTVTAYVSDGGTLLYQWYENTQNTAEGAAAIDGATGASFTPPTDTVGTRYYWVSVTNSRPEVNGTKKASVMSTAAAVCIAERTDAAAPILSTQPLSVSCTEGQSVTLRVDAAGNALTYRWFVHTENSTAGGTAIEDADASVYTFTPDYIGVRYYYAVITNTDPAATGNTQTSVTTDIASVTVSPSTYTVSGRITSVGEGDITVELLADGAAVEGIAITVTADTYTVTNVPAGTYTLRISKPRHIPYECTVTVGRN